MLHWRVQLAMGKNMKCLQFIWFHLRTCDPLKLKSMFFILRDIVLLVVAGAKEETKKRVDVNLFLLLLFYFILKFSLIFHKAQFSLYVSSVFLSSWFNLYLSLGKLWQMRLLAFSLFEFHYFNVIWVLYVYVRLTLEGCQFYSFCSLSSLTLDWWFRAYSEGF